MLDECPLLQKVGWALLCAAFSGKPKKASTSLLRNSTTGPSQLQPPWQFTPSTSPMSQGNCSMCRGEPTVACHEGCHTATKPKERGTPPAQTNHGKSSLSAHLSATVLLAHQSKHRRFQGRQRGRRALLLTPGRHRACGVLRHCLDHVHPLRRGHVRGAFCNALFSINTRIF